MKEDIEKALMQLNCATRFLLCALYPENDITADKAYRYIRTAKQCLLTADVYMNDAGYNAVGSKVETGTIE